MARDVLGDEKYEELFDRGTVMSYEDVLGFALEQTTARRELALTSAFRLSATANAVP